MDKRYFEFHGADAKRGTTSSSKFWEVWVEGSTLYTRFGKIGANGQTTVKEFPTPEKAEAAQDKAIVEKTKKGYAEGAEGNPIDLLQPADSEDEEIEQNLVWQVPNERPIPAEYIHPKSFLLDDWQTEQVIKSAEVLASWANHYQPETENGTIKLYDSEQFEKLKNTVNERNCWSIDWGGSGDQFLAAGLYDPESGGNSYIVGFLVTKNEWQDADVSPATLSTEIVPVELDFDCEHFDEENDDEEPEDYDDCPKCLGNGHGAVDLCDLIELETASTDVKKSTVNNSSGLPCSSCNEPLQSDAKFCSSCGREVHSGPAFCSQCGSKRGDGAIFCGECGTKF